MTHAFRCMVHATNNRWGRCDDSGLCEVALHRHEGTHRQCAGSPGRADPFPGSVPATGASARPPAGTSNGPTTRSSCTSSPPDRCAAVPWPTWCGPTRPPSAGRSPPWCATGWWNGMPTRMTGGRACSPSPTSAWPGTLGTWSNATGITARCSPAGRPPIGNGSLVTSIGSRDRFRGVQGNHPHRHLAGVREVHGEQGRTGMTSTTADTASPNGRAGTPSPAPTGEYTHRQIMSPYPGRTADGHVPGGAGPDRRVHGDPHHRRRPLRLLRCQPRSPPRS